jgi:hypothetical protein
MLQQKIGAVENISCSRKFLCLALCQGSGDLVYPNKAIDETPEPVSIGLKSGL